MDRGDYRDSEYYKNITSHFADKSDQKSFALRLIIHYSGDIHQPLHTVALVNDKYPAGDQGGNLEKVLPVEMGIDNFHDVWDSVGYDYPGYATLPLTKIDYIEMGDEVTKMAELYPVSGDD